MIRLQDHSSQSVFKNFDSSRLFNDFSDSLEKRDGFLTEDNVRYLFFASMLKQDKQLNHYTLELPYRVLDCNAGFDDLVLNAGLSNTDKLKLDMFHSKGEERLCFEFKFHRNPSSCANKKKGQFPHTMSAGEIFNDIQRLKHITAKAEGIICRRLLVYVTDNEMHEYLGNPGKKEGRREFRESLRSFYCNEHIDVCFSGEIKNSANSNVDKEKNTTFMKYAIKSLEIGSANLFCHVDARCLYSKNITCKSPSLKKTHEKDNLHVKVYEIF